MTSIYEKAHKIVSEKNVSWDVAVWDAFDRNQNLIYQKNTRLNKRVESIITKENAVFYTLTLNEKSLNNISLEHLEREAKKWARKYLDRYLGNLDYGDEVEHTGRPHFHIVGNYKIKPEHVSWPYGAINFKRVYNENFKRIKNYILKLSLHATKKTACKIFKSQKI